MEPILGADNNILYYEDDNVYLEINISFKKYGSEKSLCMEYDCQGKAGEEFYPLVFIEKKEIITEQELIEAINNAIIYTNNVSDFKLSPLENNTLTIFAQNMFKIYFY